MRRAVRVIEDRLVGYRLERCVQPDNERVLLALYGRSSGEAEGQERGEKFFLLLCCAPTSARVSKAEGLPKAPQNPPAFVSWLRAHLKSARLMGARLLGEDRQLSLRFASREGEFDLVLALLGQRSNLYVTDMSGRIKALLRPAAQTRPELELGEIFALPGSVAPKLGEDRFSDFLDQDLLGAIEHYYAKEESTGREAALGRDIRRALKRERKNTARRLEKLEAELAEADLAPELQRHGELLKSSLGRVSPGASEVSLLDYETGEEVVVPLDPKLDARQNLEAIFKRYKKLLRRLSRAGGQVDSVRETLDKWKRLESALAEALETDSGPDQAALETLAAEPEVARLLGRREAKISKRIVAAEAESSVPKRFRPFPRRLHPRRYRSRDGLEIWVGRSDEGNDVLTTRLAHGSDLFFHLDGAPGSHVVLCTEGRADPPQESLLDACELAIHFSKQKKAGRADVHIVPIKQVKKPKGAKPGLVWVTGGRSLHLRREEKRLGRLLDSRMEL